MQNCPNRPCCPCGSKAECPHSVQPVTIDISAIPKMREMLKVQGESGNWNYNNYMHGMYNGMECMLAMLEGREPLFKETPAEWLSDSLKPGASPAAEQVQTDAARNQATDEQQIEWSHDLQTRLMEAAQDIQEDEDARNLMAEAACLLAALTSNASAMKTATNEGEARDE